MEKKGGEAGFFGALNDFRGGGREERRGRESCCVNGGAGPSCRHIGAELLWGRTAGVTRLWASITGRRRKGASMHLRAGTA